jgi:hypothetical protein
MSQLKIETLFKYLKVTDFWGEEVYFPFYHHGPCPPPGARARWQKFDPVDLGFFTDNHSPKAQMFKVGKPELGYYGPNMHVAFREKVLLEKFISEVKTNFHPCRDDFELVDAILSFIRMFPECCSSEAFELQKEILRKRRNSEFSRFDFYDRSHIYINIVSKSEASYKVHNLGDSSRCVTTLAPDPLLLSFGFSPTSSFMIQRAESKAWKQNPNFIPVNRKILEITKKDEQTLFFPILRNYCMAYNTLYPYQPLGVAMDTFQGALDFLDLVSPNVYPECDSRCRKDVRTVGKAKKILEDVSRRLFHLKNSLMDFTANEDTREWVAQEVQKVYPKGEVFHCSRTTTYEFGSI